MKNATPANRVTQQNEAALREIALAYPEAHEDFPWGERAIKVRGKVFLFLSASGEGLSLSTKLPQSAKSALLLPFAEPTHYGLGKSGWVTASFGARDKPPIAIFRAWIDESYRAVAPKKLVASLSPVTPAAAKRSPAAPRASHANSKLPRAKPESPRASRAKPKAPRESRAERKPPRAPRAKPKSPRGRVR